MNETYYEVVSAFYNMVRIDITFDLANYGRTNMSEFMDFTN